MTENTGSGWREQLSALYDELDQEIEAKGWICRGCGECCHFDTVDHILYAGTLERRYLSEAVPPERPDGSPELLAQGLRCPFQKNSRCTARSLRPLGCRLHFCDAPEDSDFFEYWHSRLKLLHSVTDNAWEYRPLLPLKGE